MYHSFLIHSSADGHHSFSSKEEVSFNFMAVVTIHSDFGAQENKSDTVYIFFPIYLPWSDRTICNDLCFFECCILSQLFHSPLSPSQEALKFLFAFCHLLSTNDMQMSSAYLTLLVFLPSVLIPAYDSSIQDFHMMYTTYKLNKPGDNIQSWYTPFPIVNKSFFHVQF